jgi:hypothetical protein
MNFADAIAFCALMIAGTSVLGIVFDAYKRRLQSRENQLELQVRLAEATAGATAGKAGEFEERLRVLERIATDGNTALAAQIDELRSLDALEDRTGGREKAL